MWIIGRWLPRCRICARLAGLILANGVFLFSASRTTDDYDLARRCVSKLQPTLLQYHAKARWRRTCAGSLPTPGARGQLFDALLPPACPLETCSDDQASFTLTENSRFDIDQVSALMVFVLTLFGVTLKRGVRAVYAQQGTAKKLVSNPLDIPVGRHFRRNANAKRFAPNGRDVMNELITQRINLQSRRLHRLATRNGHAGIIWFGGQKRWQER